MTILAYALLSTGCPSAQTELPEDSDGVSEQLPGCVRIQKRTGC